MAVPTGIITFWNDIIENIPSGWQICDGTNGTPDMRSKFIRGASNDGEVGSDGGSLTHTHTYSSGLDSSGNHNHSISGTTGNASSTTALGVSSGGANVTGQHSHTYSGSTDSKGSHTHSISGDSDAASNLPSYVKLFYIMKI